MRWSHRSCSLFTWLMVVLTFPVVNHMVMAYSVAELELRLAIVRIFVLYVWYLLWYQRNISLGTGLGASSVSEHTIKAMWPLLSVRCQFGIRCSQATSRGLSLSDWCKRIMNLTPVSAKERSIVTEINKTPHIHICLAMLPKMASICSLSSSWQALTTPVNYSSASWGGSRLSRHLSISF